MRILKSICLFLVGMSFLAYPCVLHGQDAIDAEIRDEMMALHPDVRKPGLAAIRRNHNLSDDEFSARLVKLATVTTNGQDATLRMFTVAAIKDFGTTNALDFLENEVRRGNIVAISEYGVITGYDDRFFELAEPLVDDKRKETWGRREPVYNAFRSLLNKKDIRDREIPVEIRKRAIADLTSWANEDVYYADYIDQILSEKEETYRTNAIREAIARFALNNPESSDYTRNYFKTVLEQMGKEDFSNELDAISNVASKTTAQQLQAEPSDCSAHKELTEKNATPSFPPTSARQHCSMAFFIILAFLVFGMALAIVIFHRRRK